MLQTLSVTPEMIELYYSVPPVSQPDAGEGRHVAFLE